MSPALSTVWARALIDPVIRSSDAASFAWSAASRSSRFRAANAPPMSAAATTPAMTSPRSPNTSIPVPSRRRSTPSQSTGPMVRGPGGRYAQGPTGRYDTRGADRRSSGSGRWARRWPRTCARAGFEVSGWNRTAGRAAGPGRSSAPPRRRRRRRPPGPPTSSSSASPTRPTSRPSCSARTASPTGVAAGSLVIDMSTISPSASRGFADRLREQGVGFVDAPGLRRLARAPRRAR